MAEPDALIPRAAFGLLVLIRPYGRETVPEAFDRGRALFEAATADYDGGQYVAAARGFAAAADALVTEADNTYASNFSHNRGLAYRNAAWASQMAGQPDLGRDVLRAAAAHDAECAPEIEQIIGEILDG